jgi:hypothetical protein
MYQSSTLEGGPKRIDTWILDAVLARLPPDNAAALTEPIVPRWSATLPYRITEGLPVTRPELGLGSDQTGKMTLLLSILASAVRLKLEEMKP